MKYVKPSKIKGKISAPASKSIMQRAVALGLLSKKTTKIINPSLCDDSLASLDIIKTLGAKVSKRKNFISVKGTGSSLSPKKDILNCRESGLCMRMFSPIAALSDNELTITGEGSLLKRPINMIRDTLTKLGAFYKTTLCNPPAKIKGPLKGGNTSIDGSLTSQFLTGLLITLPLCSKDSKITVENLKSKKYVNMTLELLEKFGAYIKYDSKLTQFEIPGNQEYACDEICIEGDWSGAAFLLVAGAIAGEVSLLNLKINSSQADEAILEALKKAGTSINISKNEIIAKKNKLKAFEFDATDCPDLFPPLVALASACKGKSKIYGAHRLIHKESNRAKTLQLEFTCMGVPIKVIDNYIEVTGSTKIPGGITDSHNDHRIAMACAVAALSSVMGVRINNWQAISKSYPQFFKDISSLEVK